MEGASGKPWQLKEKRKTTNNLFIIAELEVILNNVIFVSVIDAR